ncbi:LacI family DNA-binding transcriptional regulator [Oleisolibacter albus]|uniref:LacI family DNA-binding transcriptional regulator n=1 Tax=Oleisolibacter albus TaxID=2171757 RepID=UPI0019602F33|nr:LacI family DNA-binding transcriptional regulator [Oleisolibacter albus]
MSRTKSPPAKQKSAADGQSTKGPEGGRTSRRSSGSVTLEDVAKLAGVSPITVSRVLNRPELVTQETLDYVRSVIARTGYVPNLLAGGLASRKSRLVAAIVPTIANSMFAEGIETLTERLRAAGYQVLLGLSGFPTASEEQLIGAVLSRRPDAVFLTGITHSTQTRQRLLAAKIPVVETWDLTPTPIDMVVGFSHEKVGRTVAEYLWAKGYRRFGMVCADDTRALLRRRTFIEALAPYGITDVPTAIAGTPTSLKRGRDGLIELLSMTERPDAIVCSSDVLAHGVLTEARARGLSVPRDMAVMGFGDLEYAPYTIPALSTVRIDRRGIGQRAAEAMLARFNGEPVQQVVDVGFEIVEREST